MTRWRRIETLPADQEALLYQPPSEFNDGGIIVGSLDRSSTWAKHEPPFWVNPSHIGGYEMECSIEKPTHWAELPKVPK